MDAPQQCRCVHLFFFSGPLPTILILYCPRWNPRSIYRLNTLTDAGQKGIRQISKIVSYLLGLLKQTNQTTNSSHFPLQPCFPQSTPRVRIYLLSKKRETWKLFALETAPPLIIPGRFVSLSLAFFQKVYLQYTIHPILTYGGSFYFSGHHSPSTSLNRLLIPNS